MEWTSKKYNEYWDSYVPWLEDKYLAWRGENKTSYTAKQNLKTPIAPEGTGVDKLQDGLAEGVGGQLDQGGLLGKVGEASSKEGMNRVERGEPQAASKSWTETMSAGYLGKDGKK